MPSPSSAAARKPPLLWPSAALALITALVLALAPRPAGAQAGASVSIQQHMFMPADITVPAGATVTWTNEDGAPHTVTSDAKGRFNSGWKFKGGHFSFTFAQPGTYPYHCSIHKEMHGMVTVTGG